MYHVFMKTIKIDRDIAIAQNMTLTAEIYDEEDGEDINRES